MSKSRKKTPIVKINGYLKDSYWKTVRTRQKQDLREGKDITDRREIIGDWDYIDYISNCSKDKNCYCMKRFGRKKCLAK